MSPACGAVSGERRDGRAVVRPGRARSLRLLALLLVVSGCAVETPRPSAVSPPAPERPPVALAPPPIISRFGEGQGTGGGPRPWQHAGIDIRAPIGTPVLAAADGTVLRTGRQALAGKLIVVSHADDLATVYFHLSEIEVLVGQAVQRGQVIGRTGVTGNATTPHLHFGVCRQEGARCGERLESGWADPTTYWVEGNPCFVAGHAPPARPIRLTYPLPCSS